MDKNELYKLILNRCQIEQKEEVIEEEDKIEPV